MRTAGCIIALGIVAGIGPPARAVDGPLVGPVLNLDGPAIPGPGETAASGALRFFGSKQDGVFADLRLDYGLVTGLAAALRGTAGPRRVYGGGLFTIRHGGCDAELLLRYMPPGTQRCAVEIGVSLADTPAQKDLFPTVQLLHARDLGSGLTLNLAPRAVFIEDNTLVGIGGGLALRLTDTGELVADATAIVHGDNTYSTSTGARARRAVWGVALRMMPSGGDRHRTIEIGVTNALGGTTGMSLTPGLGGSLAGYASYGCRY